MIVKTTKPNKKIPKGIAWFKTDEVYRHVGRLKVLTYFQVLTNGKIQKLDTVRMKVATQASFGGEPIGLAPIKKAVWIYQVKKVLKRIDSEML